MKNKLRQIREARHLSAAQLGKGIGISGTQIQRLEMGEREFRLEILLSLCGFLGVTADEIIDIPIKGINKAKCDETLMDSALGFVLEAIEQHKIKADRKQIAHWTTFIYNSAVDLGLNVQQTRQLAKTVVKSSL